MHRLRNRARYDQAVLLLKEVTQDQSDSLQMARLCMTLGDALRDKGLRDGSLADAVEQYATTAERYRSLFPDLVDDAEMRQVRLLWRLGRRAEAKAIAERLKLSENMSIVEEATHLGEFMPSMENAASRPTEAGVQDQ